MTVLITGGAGFIGSHMVRVLQRAGRPVAVIDNLLTGHRSALAKDVPFLEASVSDRHAVTAFLRKHGVTSVMHFASRIQVGESVVDPRLYYVGNLGETIQLIESVLDAGVPTFVLSSTAAVYGNPRSIPIDEEHPREPINPYGETKLAIERLLESYAKAYGLRFAALRYFNAAGADWESGLGELHDPESHLIPIILDAAMGRRPGVTIFGDDYATPDGTCVRDYIHVVDLCEAHLKTLEYLERGGASAAINLGTGVGHSVREVIDVATAVTKRTIPTTIGPRRDGDPPFLVASETRAQSVLGWRARLSNLERIVRDAWEWHRIAFGSEERTNHTLSQWERPS